jgi:hypothetical protein
MARIGSVIQARSRNKVWDFLAVGTPNSGLNMHSLPSFSCPGEQFCKWQIDWQFGIDLGGLALL